MNILQKWRERREMKYRTNSEKAAERNRIRRSEEIRSYYDSKPEKRDPKAYERFKAESTNYGSGKLCEYGDKTKVCDPSCRFWNTCIKGKHRIERSAKNEQRA